MTRSEEEDPNTKIQDPKNPKKLQIPKLQWAHANLAIVNRLVDLLGPGREFLKKNRALKP